MASVQDVLDALRQADEATVGVESAAHIAHDQLNEAFQILRSAVAGSSEPDTEQALAQWEELVSRCARLILQVTAARSALAVVTARLRTPAPPPTAPTQHTLRSHSAPTPALVVTAPDGSYYPAGAAWCADMLPPRVRQGMREPTVGYVDGSFAQFRSGRDNTWSPAVKERMTRLGIRSGLNLQNHVEMKVATMMISTARRSATVTINHSPCGSQPEQTSWMGCHQVLETFLPTGYTLTVQGTTGDGQAYQHSYEGRA